jgi:type IV pilus assembly protein PilE
LLELMIVVIVISILAALAISSYQKQVRKSRRADAKSTLGEYALKLEKWRTNAVDYGVASGASNVAFTNIGITNVSGVATTPGKYYTVAFSVPSGSTCAGGAAWSNANSYTLTATAIGDQVKDKSCPTIVYANLCGTVTKTPTECW